MKRYTLGLGLVEIALVILAVPTGPLRGDGPALEKKEAPPAKKKEAPAEGKTQMVVTEGVGTSKDEAIKDAFRNAVRQVVGAVVDAETLVKNDEVISDKVLTYSDGLVKKYEEMSKKESKGLFRVKIKATVERRSVIAKLKEAKVTVKEVDGAGLFAEIVTGRDAAKNAKLVVENALEGFPVTVLHAEATGNPEISDNAGKETVQIKVQVRVQPDKKRYADWSSRVQQKLASVALKKGEYSVVAKKNGWPKGRAKLKGGQDAFVIPFDSKGWVSRMPGILLNHRTRRLEAEKGQVAIALCTHVSDSADSTNWAWYGVDESVKKSLISLSGKSPQLKCSLLSAEGKLVASKTLPVSTPLGSLRCVCPWGGMERNRINHKSNSIDREALFLIAPLFMGSNTAWHMGQYYYPLANISVPFSLSLEELQSVKSIKCEVFE
jgi:hypothetical protein